MSDVWPIVHAERQVLADDLGNLSSDQWATPSLCDGWDVHDVFAHLMALSPSVMSVIGSIAAGASAIRRAARAGASSPAKSTSRLSA